MTQSFSELAIADFTEKRSIENLQRAEYFFETETGGKEKAEIWFYPTLSVGEWVRIAKFVDRFTGSFTAEGYPTIFLVRSRKADGSLMFTERDRASIETRFQSDVVRDIVAQMYEAGGKLDDQVEKLSALLDQDDAGEDPVVPKA